MASPTISRDEWMDGLIAALNIPPEIPEGSGVTIRDFMRRGMNERKARRAILQSVEEGRLREIGVRRNGKGLLKVYEVTGN